jgi:uncharacterized protein YdhG (YjbR/CyaY superfamily)
MKPAPKDVDEYIENAPKDSRTKLTELRDAIREVSPEATERISYGMPSYIKDRRRVYFGVAKSHIGLYGISAPVLDRYKEEVSPYVGEKGTVRLPLDEELPVGLVKKLVRARMEGDEPPSP